MSIDPNDYDGILKQRIESRPRGWLDIRSNLRHFALINYAVPINRLLPHIPRDQFEVAAFNINGRTCGLLSVVPFLDDDFHFTRLAPFAKFRFGQTNHRIYVVHRATQQHCAWFFGTTLGSWVVNCARTLWRIPWHRAKYEYDCQWDDSGKRYAKYQFHVQSDWCDCEIELEDTGAAMARLDGFESIEKQKLVLTHPVDGYFRRLDGALGTYSVWHDEIPLTVGRSTNCYFSLYEKLGILNRTEMQCPHSVLICPQTLFDVHMPPKRVRV